MRLACPGLFSSFKKNWFEKNATIVAPSRLLAAVASRQYTEFQLRSGAQSWQRPSIYSVEAWLTACWQEARYAGSSVPALLSPAQERMVWLEIIEEEEPGLFDAGSTAQLASSAARLLNDWHITLSGDIWHDHQDAQHFLRWHSRFRQRCREQGWITRSEVFALLPVWIERGLCQRQLTVLVAFDVLTPALERLRRGLGDWCAFEPATPATERRKGSVLACVNVAEEVEHSARWARAVLEEDGQRSVGVFVPDLARHHALIERTFQQVFYPAAGHYSGRAALPGEQDSIESSVFHMHAPQPLDERPIIANACLILELAHPRIEIAAASSILRSPFLQGAEEERSARAKADVRLRKLREVDVSLLDLEHSTRECRSLTQIWPELKRLVHGKPGLMELPGWSEFMAQLLNAVGWPGDRDLQPAEQELVELWNGAVSDLASLGITSRRVSYEVAIRQLKGLLSANRLERGDWFSPIQILDAAEATGLQFDVASVIGLSNETWPPLRESSPLIPRQAQRANNVTGSSPQDVQRISRKLTESLMAVAPRLVATYSGKLSPVAAELVEHQSGIELQWPGRLPLQSSSPIGLEEIVDGQAPAFHSDEPPRGGTGVIKAQSLCPFRAFAEYRLRSEVLEEACFGFDSRDRGSFMHKALQNTWEVIETQDRLRSSTPDRLRAVVHEAVSTAVKEASASPFHQLTSSAERQRLEELILEWLSLEAKRSTRFTVENLEQERSYAVPGLRLTLRVDRIDRLNDGSIVLIDYKSGAKTRPKLKGERPAEPQLLVYAAAVDERVDGVFFAQLKPRDLRAVGFSSRKHFGDRTAEVLKDRWDDYLRDSRANVAKIAGGFVAGAADVDPIPGACEYCRQKPLCRVRERGDNSGEDEDDSD